MRSSYIITIGMVRDNLEGPEVDGRIILKWILKE
jgi:hypothetical protein